MSWPLPGLPAPTLPWSPGAAGPAPCRENTLSPQRGEPAQTSSHSPLQWSAPLPHDPTSPRPHIPGRLCLPRRALAGPRAPAKLRHPLPPTPGRAQGLGQAGMEGGRGLPERGWGSLCGGFWGPAAWPGPAWLGLGLGVLARASPCLQAGTLWPRPSPSLPSSLATQAARQMGQRVTPLCDLAPLAISSKTAGWEDGAAHGAPRCPGHSWHHHGAAGAHSRPRVQDPL